MSEVDDSLIRPKHYTSLKPEPIEVIEAWELGFCLGNAVKYIARAGKKGDPVEDLKKAAWYLEREIDKLSSTPEHQNFPDMYPGWTGPYYDPRVLPWHKHWETHLIPSNKMPRGLQQTVIRQGDSWCSPLYKVEVKNGGAD
jgi:hypothetical protein